MTSSFWDETAQAVIHDQLAVQWRDQFGFDLTADFSFQPWHDLPHLSVAPADEWALLTGRTDFFEAARLLTLRTLLQPTSEHQMLDMIEEAEWTPAD